MPEIWKHKIARIAGYYEALAERYGHDSRACDYGHPESQWVRFSILSQVMPLQGKRVLDVGCGFGDFADALIDRYGDLVYEGIDIAPRMVEEARRLHPNLSFRVLDLLNEDPGGPYDLITASGIFYLLGEDAESHMQRLILRMFELSSCGVAFNSLSAWASRKEPAEFYADPLGTVKFCRTVSPWVVLRHDYMEHDFTIYMYREPCHV
jgi:SAM-dependent methyltransferase